MINKKNNNKNNALAIIFLFLFFPVGLYFMWTKTSWNKKVKWTITSVYAIFILFGIMGSSSSQTSDTGTKASVKEAVQVTKTTEKPKTPEEQLKAIAKEVVGDDKADVHEVNGRWVIFASRMDMDFAEPLAFDGAKQITHDFMFKVYATKLPIQSVEIVMKSPSNGKYFNAALGNSVAAQNPASTWTDDSVGPTIFYNFLVQNTNSSEANDLNDAGTFVDTNME